MSFQITVTILLAFFVPGVISLGGVRALSPTLNAFVNTFMAAPSTQGGMTLLAASFVLGVLVDTLRVGLMDRWIEKRLAPSLDRWERREDKTKFPAAELSSAPSYLRSLTSSNLPVFLTLIEKTHDYYRLAANTFVSLAVVSTVQATSYGLSSPLATTKLVGLVMLAAGVLLAAVRNHQSSKWAMREFAAIKEEEKCAKDSRA